MKTGISKLKPTFQYYVNLYPDYLPFAFLLWNSILVDKGPKTDLKFPDNLHLKNYYPEKKTFCIEEFSLYFHLMVMYYGICGETANLMMLVAYLEANRPGLIPETEMFTARILVLPKVLEWCEEWVRGNVK
jgi:hypothetical protein